MTNIGHLSEPDFIGLKKSVGGCNSSEGNISPIDLEYYVFEAKGGRGRNGTTFDKAINKQLPVVRSINGKYPKSYVLGYSVCEAEYISSGVTVHNLLKIIVAESNQTRHDAYDIVLGASISTPMYLFEKFVTDLYEEVGELKKFQEFAKTGDRSVSLFNDIDITDASVENEIILNIKYDKMRSIDVILERRTGVVSVVERRDVLDSVSSKSTVSIIDLNENQVYVTPPEMTDK